MRKLTYTGYCGQQVKVDLDQRAEPMFVPGDIIAEANVALGLPLTAEIAIRATGEIVVRSYSWNTHNQNSYWHVSYITQMDIDRGFLTPTEEQKAAIWRLWANKHPFRKVHDIGVGQTLLQITRIGVDEAVKKYLNNEWVPLA